MLFGAHQRPGLGRVLREFVWPTSGWRRRLSYLGHRLARLPGSPHSIAAGFACGAAASFTPFVGLHFVIAGLIAWAIGANVIASAIGTAVGNPWTFPFIWFWAYRVGSWLLGVEPGEGFHIELSPSYLMDNAYRLLLPMAVGGIPLAIAAWIASYWPLRYLLAGYQLARRARRARRAARRGRESGK